METPPRSTDADVDRDGAPLRSTLVAIGLTVFGLIAAEIATLPAFLVDPVLLEATMDGQLGEASIEGRTLLLILNFVGMALAGVIYLLVTDRGLSWVDLYVPTKADWKYLIAGSIGSIVFLYLVSILFTLLDVPAAESQVIDIVGQDQTMILIMIGIVFFFNAPAEEFLFRNVIQKRLYEAFTRMQAILVTSVIFALVHLPMYLVAETFVATLASLSIMFGGSVIFGYVYAKTDNLLVPTVAHAVLNAFQFALLYIAIEFGIDEAQPAPSAVVDVLTALAL
ncbi:CPBP family intramembrane glutamic endopeptidase [Natronolimnohabitans sp. A-GB9]|uniref:CPBP family intramembrane glutamic endopeptidase n=1 Tax=Natronolimnohabitans sp. A-GB9 TaxID=3069757 RepID=UPI0027B465C9|nr:CPBP family intramembrane glutamic endopeptidase [Natronolimnohabitans sp. A-GB9]MDQ2051825.1 CPBP family intramembrane glutamic endopeptidase [Natronolimnohabitans sp. A-GB9]